MSTFPPPPTPSRTTKNNPPYSSTNTIDSSFRFVLHPSSLYSRVSTLGVSLYGLFRFILYRLPYRLLYGTTRLQQLIGILCTIALVTIGTSIIYLHRSNDTAMNRDLRLPYGDDNPSSFALAALPLSIRQRYSFQTHHQQQQQYDALYQDAVTKVDAESRRKDERRRTEEPESTGSSGGIWSMLMNKVSLHRLRGGSSSSSSSSAVPTTTAGKNPLPYFFIPDQDMVQVLFTSRLGFEEAKEDEGEDTSSTNPLFAASFSFSDSNSESERTLPSTTTTTRTMIPRPFDNTQITPRYTFPRWKKYRNIIQYYLSSGDEILRREKQALLTVPFRTHDRRSSSPEAPSLNAIDVTNDPFSLSSSLIGQPCGPSDTTKSFPNSNNFMYDCRYYPSPMRNGHGIQCCCHHRNDNTDNPLTHQQWSMYRQFYYDYYTNITVPTSVSVPSTPRPRPYPLRPLSVGYRAFTCLPSVLIAGVQKAGTTALMSYLLHHPNFYPAVKKEVHYFDKLWDKGVETYLRHMPMLLPPPPSSSSSPPDNEWERSFLRHVLTGEASPSYVLGTEFAERVNSLLPHASIVVILRDPVDRAYSEYQMKKRRVRTQRHLSDINEMTDIVESIHSCYARAYAPLVALLERAVGIIRSPTFIRTVRHTLVAEKSARLLHGELNADRIVGSRLKKIPLAAVADSYGEEANLPPNFDHTWNKADEGKTRMIPTVDESTFLFGTNKGDQDRLFRYQTKDKKNYVPAMNLLKLPRSSIRTNVTRAIQTVWDSLHLPIDDWTTFWSTEATNQRKQNDRAYQVRESIVEVWNNFLNQLTTLGNDPLLNGALKEHLSGTIDGEGGDETTENDQKVNDGANEAAEHRRRQETETLRIHMIIQNIQTFLSSFWDMYGYNITTTCIAHDILNAPELAPLQRLGPPVVNRVRSCLVRRGKPSIKDPEETWYSSMNQFSSAGGNRKDHDKGNGMNGIVPSFLERLKNSFMASASDTSSSSFFRSSTEKKDTGVRSSSTANDNTPTIEHFLQQLYLTAFSFRSRSIDQRFDESTVDGIPIVHQYWGWLGTNAPELLDTLLRISVQSLIPAFVQEGYSIGNGTLGFGIGVPFFPKSTEAEAEGTAYFANLRIPSVSSEFSNRTIPYSPMDQAFFGCFALPEGDGKSNTLTPRYEDVGDFGTLIQTEREHIHACSNLNIPRGKVRNALGISRDGKPVPNSQASSMFGTKKIRLFSNGGGGTVQHPKLGGDGSGTTDGSFIRLLESLPVGNRAIILDGQKDCYPTGSSSNIAVDFLYRGIYINQLARLYGSIQRSNEQILILTDNELRKAPQTTLDKLLSFLGLPLINIQENYERYRERIKTMTNDQNENEEPFTVHQFTETSLRNVLEAVYPSFGKTGWRMEGGYPPMPDDIRKQLQDFYRPYNYALYEYLGYSLGWDY